MRRQLFILSIFIFTTIGLCSQPGTAGQEPIKVPSSSAVQSTVDSEQPIIEITTAEQAVTPETVEEPLAKQQSIYIRHIRTYDLPQNKDHYDLPKRIFVLELQLDSSGSPYSDVILDTNVGFGIMRGELGAAQADILREIEIACNPEMGDECLPQSIIVHNATAALDRRYEQSHARTDILSKLRRNNDTFKQFETKNGLLPSSVGSEKAKDAKCPAVQIAYEGENTVHGRITVVRLTFPPGQKKLYKNPTLVTSRGHNISGDWFEDSRSQDSYMLRLSDTYTETMDQEYAPRDSGKLGESGIFIREACAWRNGKKVNLLPCLVEDSFRMLPIRFSGRDESASLPGSN